MFNTATLESGGSNFTIHPQGSYSAVCVCVIDLGTQLIRSPMYGDKNQRKVRITFETSEIVPDEGDYKGKPYLAQSQFTLTSSEQGLLRPFIEGWRGRKYANETDAVAGLAKMDKMLGHPALLNIVHSDDGKYANIQSASPLMKGAEPLKPVMDTIIFSLDQPDWTVFDKLTDNTQKKIMESPEYKKLRGDPELKAVDSTEHQYKDATGGPPVDFDDDIPF